MLDKQGRIALRKGLIKTAFNITELKEQYVNIFFDKEENIIQIVQINNSDDVDENFYFIKRVKMDVKGRIFVPDSIKKAFPNASYLPAMRNGKLYILIV